MKIGIGTAQFGLKYGLTNYEDKTSLSEARKILEIAQSYGVQMIDTAKAYGSSEEVLGKVLPSGGNFKIVTKVPKYKYANTRTNKIKAHLFDSLTKLKRKQIYGLLLHHSADLLSDHGEEIYEALCHLKEDGYIKKIGISIYNPIEADEVLQKYKIDLVQLPINLLDQRFKQSGCLKTISQLGIEIHARSIFLQGLLLEDPAKLPPFFYPIKSKLKHLQNELLSQNISLLEGALNFVANLEEVDYMIIGINNSIQLKEIFQSLNNSLQNYDFSKFQIDDEKYVNPLNWKV